MEDCLGELQSLIKQQAELIQNIIDDHFEPVVFFGNRHPDWDNLRDWWIKNEQPSCMACGGKHTLQVHHIKPFWDYPELELDKNNLITLCNKPTRRCHFIFGHLMNWHSWNPDVVEDAKKFLEKRNRCQYPID